MIEVSASQFRARLASLLDSVADDHEVVRVRRLGGRPSAVVLDESEYASLAEIAHLFSDPAKCRHILDSIAEADAGNVTSYDSAEALLADLWPER